MLQERDEITLMPARPGSRWLFLTHVLGSPLRGESNLSLGENPKPG